jgi:hypothetical protein
MTLEELRDALVLHRITEHQTDDLETFFDCAVCGAMERNYQRRMQETQE